ncbi:disulfide bond formation protein B [Achromobacter xylosoxidans]
MLIVAFVWQIAYDEPPCPLCLLQRVAFMLAGVGLLLNLRLGPSPMHYAMVIAAALGGMLASGRQVLLHIAPGDPGYGTTLLGLHFYTWSFIAFVALIAFCVLMLSVRPQMGRQHAQEAGAASGLARHGPVFRHRAGQPGRHDAGMRFRALPGQSDGLSLAGFAEAAVAFTGAG